jgi:hypothetical protein
MNQNKKRKQILESAQYGLEIIFKISMVEQKNKRVYIAFENFLLAGYIKGGFLKTKPALFQRFENYFACT